ncbi:MAG: phosphate ABC transporter substrate-binding protein [Caldilineaceae bacterium]
MLYFTIAVLLLSGCQPTEVTAAKPTTISIAGATAMRPVLLDLTTEFSRQHPNVFFEIAGGGSTVGEERVRAKQIDLAASTLISPSITSALNTVQQSLPLQRVPIGLDGLAVIVHQQNPVAQLTLSRLQEMYNGRSWNWQDVGGGDQAITLITREDGSGSRMLFDERVMGETPVSLTAIVMPTSSDVVEYVAKHPEAIGYVSRAYVLDQLHAQSASQPAATSQSSELPSIRVVMLEGQLPTNETLRTQSYFLIQPLYLVSRGQPQGLVKQFVDFALSPAGQAIVGRHHLAIR